MWRTFFEKFLAPKCYSYKIIGRSCDNSSCILILMMTDYWTMVEPQWIPLEAGFKCRMAAMMALLIDEWIMIETIG